MRCPGQPCQARWMRSQFPLWPTTPLDRHPVQETRESHQSNSHRRGRSSIQLRTSPKPDCRVGPTTGEVRQFALAPTSTNRMVRARRRRSSLQRQGHRNRAHDVVAQILCGDLVAHCFSAFGGISVLHYGFVTRGDPTVTWTGRSVGTA